MAETAITGARACVPACSHLPAAGTLTRPPSQRKPCRPRQTTSSVSFRAPLKNLKMLKSFLKILILPEPRFTAEFPAFFVIRL